MSIYKKISAIMAEIDPIAKDRKNTMQNYNFRGIDDMYNALNPLLAKHGVFFTSEVTGESREERQTTKGGTLIYTILRMKWTAHAEDGTSVTTETVGEAMDSGDKSANKAMSAAYKYALMQIFCIPTEDDKDTENQTHEVAPKTYSKPAQTVEPSSLDRVYVADNKAPLRDDPTDDIQYAPLSKTHEIDGKKTCHTCGKVFEPKAGTESYAKDCYNCYLAKKK